MEDKSKALPNWKRPIECYRLNFNAHAGNLCSLFVRASSLKDAVLNAEYILGECVVRDALIDVSIEVPSEIPF